jgi:hypothetical protein
MSQQGFMQQKHIKIPILAMKVFENHVSDHKLKMFVFSPNKNKLSSTQNKILLCFKMYENNLNQLLTS